MFEIGSILREARTRQGLELDDAERRTRIRAKYFAALEEERFDQLPGEVYAKAFLRTYADFLGLDSELYVAELNSRIEASRPPPPAPERRLTLPSVDLRVAAVLGASAAVVAAGVLAWRFGGAPEERTVPGASSAARCDDDYGPASKAAAGRKAGAGPPRRDCRTRRLLALRASRLEGRGVVYEGTLREGDSLRFARKRIWVRMGAPWNLEARLNGRAVRRLPAETGNLLVTRAGVRPA